MARTPSRQTSSGAPLGVNPEREQRVRERAYLLWESEGKRHGHDVQYWERARELVSSEETEGTAPAASSTKPAAPPEPEVKEAAEKSGKAAKRPGKPAEAPPPPAAKGKSRSKSGR